MGMGMGLSFEGDLIQKPTEAECEDRGSTARGKRTSSGEVLKRCKAGGPTAGWEIESNFKRYRREPLIRLRGCL